MSAGFFLFFPSDATLPQAFLKQETFMPDALELFSAQVCPYAHRNRLVLALAKKGIVFTMSEIDLLNKSRRCCTTVAQSIGAPS
jgi:hypothetical protein